ncbi:hypothetical protein ACQEVZ_24740 [Dactylosporangium sp. CA-152071]|uniref:hypothetical protein n=1 Tax=Dactylosporangium sp. CA-152071 TaxID=3239933 RepID=UPI003D8DDCFA
MGPDGTEPDYGRTSRRRGKVAEYDADLEKTNAWTNKLKAVFYLFVLLTALGGQVSGAVEVIGVPWWVAVPAVSVLELGGVVIMRTAEVRRRLGESAIFTYLLAVGIAAFATVFNWMAHDNKVTGAFFAFMSTVGFLVWALSTEHRRRDRLRANGQMSDLPPRYEFITHWVRHPWITLRARSMAKAKPSLGLTGSLFQAELAMRRDRRVKGISRVLEKKIRKAVDPVTAGIAINAYDLDRVADELERQADYVGLTDLIAADLLPSRIAAHQAPVRVPSIAGEPFDPDEVKDEILAAVRQAVDGQMAGHIAAIESATAAATARLEAAANLAAIQRPELAAVVADEPATSAATNGRELAVEVADEPAMIGASDGSNLADEYDDEQGGEQGERGSAGGQPQRKPRPDRGSATVQKVAAALKRNPQVTAAQLAARFDVPERTMRRHVTAAKASLGHANGYDHGAAR